MNFLEAVKEMVENNSTCIYQDGSEEGVRIRYSNSLKSFVWWTDSQGWIRIDFSKFHYMSDSWTAIDNWSLKNETVGVEIAPGQFHYTEKEISYLKKQIIKDLDCYVLENSEGIKSYAIRKVDVKEILNLRFGF